MPFGVLLKKLPIQVREVLNILQVAVHLIVKRLVLNKTMITDSVAILLFPKHQSPNPTEKQNCNRNNAHERDDCE